MAMTWVSEASAFRSPNALIRHNHLTIPEANELSSNVDPGRLEELDERIQDRMFSRDQVGHANHTGD
jgi:hypothetical protein